ncbi:hypothetical protein [Actinomadura bangladeshensis]|uniref:Uncharacterized protein n=1 Tax=Actinomadura bangladeshensis TaxID=453573 RepID=A0A4V2XNU0_9ACTN|nr:hypothetical protein [Actinomadura bangladeshensis]TDC19486.1 hypothetical protein E1284_03675 [Actinomadura bangladeshensis]
MSSIIILLWIAVPAALFLTMALYVLNIGLRTRNVDLRSMHSDRGLLTVRGLNESCDTISGHCGEDR